MAIRLCKVCGGWHDLDKPWPHSRARRGDAREFLALAATLQRSPDGGTTWYDVESAVLSANGGYRGIDLGAGNYRVNFSGTPTSVSSILTGVN
jgi:hypothetical protein